MVPSDVLPNFLAIDVANRTVCKNVNSKMEVKTSVDAGGVGGLFVEAFEQQVRRRWRLSAQSTYTHRARARTRLCKFCVESATVISLVRNALRKTSAVTLDQDGVDCYNGRREQVSRLPT